MTDTGNERTAIVTGGARGLGLAMVRALLEQDVVDRVHVFDLHPADVPEAAGVHTVDVTDVESVRAGYEAVGAVPSVLVNNAGGDAGDGIANFPGPFEDPDAFRRMLDLNFTSAHVVASVIGPDLERGAAICNTASIAGQMPGPLFAYGAAKAALIHWTKSMARALGPSGIRVNAVAPGIIRTQIWEAMQPDEGLYDKTVAAMTPLGTDQTPEDIADAVAFLCSDRAASITGQVVAIDGGMTTGAPRR